MTTMCVAYKVFQIVELDDKFNRSQSSMDYAEQDKYLIDVMDALKEKLPQHADITYVGNQNTGEVLWNDDWD